MTSTFYFDFFQHLLNYELYHKAIKKTCFYKKKLKKKITVLINQWHFHTVKTNQLVVGWLQFFGPLSTNTLI